MLTASLDRLIRVKPPMRRHSLTHPTGGWDTEKAIAAARLFLQNRNPAVEGEGGDAWTYHTACCLRDRGVSEAKALELMQEAPTETEASSWNDRCDPPWDNAELATKVSNAYRYAQNTPGIALGERFNLPEIHLMPPINEKLTILDGALANASCEKQDTSEPVVFRHGGRLVVVDEAVGALEPESDGIRRARGAPLLRTLDPERLRLVASDHANFLKYDAKSNAWKLTDCPLAFARSYLAKGEWRLPVLEGIAECPTLRLDGSVVQQQGYDEASGLLLRFKDHFPGILEKPTRADTERALQMLRHPVRRMEFRDTVDKDVFVAAVVTGVTRYALDLAPLFGFSASKAGSGKTIMAQAVAEIVSGHSSTMMTLTISDQENEKRLDAALMNGDGVIVFDNCEWPISGNALCQVITNSTRSARVLGESRNVLVSTKTLLIATGNNLRVKGDMAKRTVLSYNDPTTEYPENRRFDFNLLDEVRANRGELVSAALTVILGYLSAGRPSLNVEPTRFPDWDRLVRYPIMWAGGCDVAETMRTVLEDDPDRVAIGAVLEAWKNCYGSGERVLGDVVRDISHHADDAKFRALNNSLKEALDLKPGMGVEAKQLGDWLAARQNRSVSGLKFQKSVGTTGGARRWRVVVADEAGGRRGTL